MDNETRLETVADLAALAQCLKTLHMAWDSLGSQQKIGGTQIIEAMSECARAMSVLLMEIR